MHSVPPYRNTLTPSLSGEFVNLTPLERTARLDLDDAHRSRERELLLAAVTPGDEAPHALNPCFEHLVGQTVAHYRIVGKLGSGGMGVVYEALDVRHDRRVALKFLSPQLSTDDEAKARFILEARVTSSLNHPNITTIHEISRTVAGQLFFAMSYYQGETLESRIARGALAIDEAVDLTIQIGHGLSHVHARGFVHRDVKPANVMVTLDRVAKILDFGLVKEVSRTETGARMGTVPYMSPEQVRGEAVDHRTDVWSLGAVLYEILTGDRAFKGDQQAAIIYSVLNEDPKPLADLNPDFAGLEHIVSMCLEKEKDLRYPAVSDLLADLEHVEHCRDSGSEI